MDLEQPLPEPDRLAAIARRINRPVVLVGMMGVGKSSLGRKLAQQMGVPFIDADEEIEKAAQMTIPEIFATYGEAFFRDGERRVIARLLGASDSTDGPAADHPLSRPPVSGVSASRVSASQKARGAGMKVLATGGGAFCNAETRELILKRAIAVWLDADLDTLVDRTARKDNRPLLRQGNPREILARLKAEREPFYAQAPIRVMSGNMPHARTLARLLTAIDRWLDTQGAPKSGEPPAGTPAQEN